MARTRNEPEYNKGSEVAVLERDKDGSTLWVEQDGENNVWLCERGEEPVHRPDGLAGIQAEYLEGKKGKKA